MLQLVDIPENPIGMTRNGEGGWRIDSNIFVQEHLRVMLR